MDNLTHSLIGAAMGYAGLKRRTGLAMPALIIGANLPDIDAICAVLGVESLAMRRGITHGPVALLLLPLLLAAILYWHDCRQAAKGTRPAHRLPVHPVWLVGLCYLGVLTHPLFDWFNTYGIRLLAPFSNRWYYGDTLFIIDLWIWIMLGFGVWWSRRRERHDRVQSRQVAQWALLATTLYIGLNMGLSRLAVADAQSWHSEGAVTAVAQPVPVAFWQRQILWRGSKAYGTDDWSLFNRWPEATRTARTDGEPVYQDDLRIAGWASASAQSNAFLFWSRMPVALTGPGGVWLSDQRFEGSPFAGFFVVKVEER